MLVSDIAEVKDGRIVRLPDGSGFFTATVGDGGVGSGIKGHTTSEEQENQASVRWIPEKGIKAKVKMMPISSLITNPNEKWGEKYSSGEGKERVLKMAQAMRNGASFPALIVMKKADGSGVVIDGQHRLRAALKAGIKEVGVQISEKQWTDSDSLSTFQGISINVENDKGTIRKGVDENGEPWKTKMLWPYGEIVDTEGVDHDPIDCFIGPNPDAENAYIIWEKKSGEDKVMLGFDTLFHARDAFCAHYDQPAEFLGKITQMKMEDFKTRLKTHKKGTRITKET